MKKFIKKLPLVAFVFALVGAFAFNMPEDDLNWFEVGSNGEIGAPLASEPTCNGTTDYCAVGLDDSQVDIFGNPTESDVSDYDINDIDLRKMN